jgi:hypothetical protein
MQRTRRTQLDAMDSMQRHLSVGVWKHSMPSSLATRSTAAPVGMLRATPCTRTQACKTTVNCELVILWVACSTGMSTSVFQHGLP